MHVPLGIHGASWFLLDVFHAFWKLFNIAPPTPSPAVWISITACGLQTGPGVLPSPYIPHRSFLSAAGLLASFTLSNPTSTMSDLLLTRQLHSYINSCAFLNWNFHMVLAYRSHFSEILHVPAIVLHMLITVLSVQCLHHISTCPCCPPFAPSPFLPAKEQTSSQSAMQPELCGSTGIKHVNLP